MELDSVEVEFDVKFQSLEISLDEVTEYLGWCAENKSCIKSVSLFWYRKDVKSSIAFNDSESAMAFKLRWL